MIIKNKVLKTESIDWTQIKDLQSDNLKVDYHSSKTKQSIIDNGFSRAIYVWQDGGNIYCVDGHLRMDLLYELKNDGYNIPEKLPCTFLDIKDRQEAVKVLLEVFNQKTNPINNDVLIDMLNFEGIPEEEVKIDTLDIGIAEQELDAWNSDLDSLADKADSIGDYNEEDENQWSVITLKVKNELQSTLRADIEDMIKNGIYNKEDLIIN
jgi:hypothetical protein